MKNSVKKTLELLQNNLTKEEINELDFDIDSGSDKFLWGLRELNMKLNPHLFEYPLEKEIAEET